MRHASRRAALRALLPDGVVALLVTDLVNIRYLTGFTGSNAALLVAAVGDDASVLCTDGRYRAQVAAEAPDLPVLIDRASALALAAGLAGAGHEPVGFESGHVTVDDHAALAEAAGPVPLVRAPGLVEQLRLVKDDDEVEILRRACAPADAALAGLIADGGLAEGRTELEVALDLETRMRAHGAAGPSFATIVAAGEHSAVPHHQPTTTRLRRGDLVKMDFGALVDGYHSDMTRTVVLGPAAAWQREVYELVAAAQAAGSAALAPGAEIPVVDAAARDVIAGAGHAEHYEHGLGHGVGLQIHEDPFLGVKGVGELAAGMAVTVEPGVYLPGRGGVRIEDVLVVRAGGAELLTLAPKDLVEV